ncbi:MAG: hypothetical protein ABL951_15870 [Alphaproteobacteria bacterium]
MKARQVLLAACLLLAGIAIAPWLRTPAAAPDSVQTGAASPLRQFELNDPGPLDGYGQAIQRPVFVASRRPAVAPAANSSRSGEVLLLERYPVVGVVIAGPQRLVLIRKAAGDTVSRIKQGAELDGWTLTEVSRERLVLEKDGNRKQVSLQNNASTTD